MAGSEIVIDRPEDSPSQISEFIYRVDYGYLKDTSSMDGGESGRLGRLAVKKGDRRHHLCIVDLMKKEFRNINVLIGCTEDEKTIIYETHNATPFMKVFWIVAKFRFFVLP